MDSQATQHSPAQAAEHGASIRIEDLLFRYPDSDFELVVPELSLCPGQRVACIGPSGSGKTTLAHLIAGILVPDRGRISIREHRISSLSEAERRAYRLREIGMVFQEFELLEYLTARENLLLPYHISPALRLGPEVSDRLLELARELGLEALLSRRPRKLSQGERQRVAIGRALITEPRLVICDEPTGNLDPINSRRILDLLFEMSRRHRATLLVVTHDHSQLDTFDRVLDMQHIGRESGA